MHRGAPLQYVYVSTAGTTGARLCVSTDQRNGKSDRISLIKSESAERQRESNALRAETGKKISR
ncbi:hypothetical protein GCM10028832_04060 [Streptomyces sparsus]